MKRTLMVIIACPHLRGLEFLKCIYQLHTKYIALCIPQL